MRYVSKTLIQRKEEKEYSRIIDQIIQSLLTHSLLNFLKTRLDALLIIHD